ncbi:MULTISPECIES: NAD(P)/FAD-dependent oxidoreductase [Thalassospira]|jgi:L-2-hydroxyglutarate oxidase LhgO|uniref:FAD-dependent oxidoreductase n=1 Tax=Thalassospira xiamenensis TaxID=220697 RepID=A0ABR5XVK5_9PROT|nr:MULTISPECIES: NAD(P)/FAD-dependent oxidoreductase [Thalassospira]MBL4839842.1 NAD(P)/FAD-dependent oxidoreductase [Thalassospira sp.]MBR9779533.1 NAD(P)/FAD-dependent oxidoreductase [Rhodospirillales bacterium]KZC96774.1 FAD-dependent oxidoreductase [Thalassospira xiamenensis]KZD04398.1 FAD-dependent oxidoreductase [Thalassospira xiamenensis]MBR9817088.1 NAD(P)/FAD-dependent oxidoreductase [Rhodospirillales bacterium]|tara:strand:- start:14978 stop:16111 length:1134 start_codon:yes stop_codon:yes gene_type:complete
MTTDIQTVIIGAGVVGLACARALAKAGREVLIIERHDAIGTETSARNSEVIHAGIYYPQNSLKARFCVAGRDMLYRYCAENGIDHKRTGKLIVATHNDQIPALRDIEKRARENGVHDLVWLDGHDAIAREPALNCVAALESPSTGIIDSHQLMVTLLGEAEANGATLALNTDVVSAKFENGIFAIETLDRDGQEMSLTCAELLIAGGLHSQTLAHNFTGLPDQSIPPQHYARGCYFTLSGKAPFSTLIYPAPEQAGLGIHLTLDLGGQARFGPDVTWVEEPNYDVPEEKRAGFAAAIRKYYPSLDENALQTGYAGVRPKIQAPGEAARDFLISDREAHGIDGLVILYGIESPGLTACLAIADHVENVLSRPQAKAAS